MSNYNPVTLQIAHRSNGNTVDMGNITISHFIITWNVNASYLIPVSDMSMEEKEVCMKLVSDPRFLSWNWNSDTVSLDQYYYAYYISVLLGHGLDLPSELLDSEDFELPDAIISDVRLNVPNQEQYLEILRSLIQEYISDTYPTPIPGRWIHKHFSDMTTHVFCGSVMVLNLCYTT